MFNRKTKELQSLVDSSRKSLKEAESRIKNKNIVIADLQNKNEELTKENLAVHEENKELRFENEEQADLIRRISNLVSLNKYNNEKVFLNKIKELVSDYQSIN